MSKNIVIVATRRYSINANDYWMFFSRSKHNVVKVLFPETSKQVSWFNSWKKKDAARIDICDPIPKNKIEHYQFGNNEQLKKKIDKYNPDIVCVGNGNDPTGKFLTNCYSDKMLYSEYGWLPWNQHFYITRGGTSIDSDIAKLKILEIFPRGRGKIIKDMQNFKWNYLNNGNPVKPNQQFFYVPLQVDKNDFKFGLTKFKNNEEFIKHVINIVPCDYDIYFKHHPLNKNRCSINQFKDYAKKQQINIRDISDSNLNKFELMSRMMAMICINSTSVLEALHFNRPIFTYGEDIYCNKGIVNHNVFNNEEFFKKFMVLDKDCDIKSRQKFIGLLLERQINRKRCIDNDTKYINNHYWSKSL